MSADLGGIATPMPLSSVWERDDAAIARSSVDRGMDMPEPDA